MKKLLSVATASLHPKQLLDVQNLQFPRVDYIELQRYLDAETMDYRSYDHKRMGGIFRRLETQLRSDVILATLSWWRSHKFSNVFIWSERAGIPFSAYRHFFASKSRFTTMFQCWSPKQEFVVKALNLFSNMDRIIVHCESMQNNLIRLGAPAEKVKLINYSIDQIFFRPLTDINQSSDVILSVGESRSRNYGALFNAVRGLPVTVKVAGFGHWYAREKRKSTPVLIPENVSELNHLSQWELRNQYANSHFVVIPVYDRVFSAGATASLEAGSMARAVIAFHSRGISDYIIHGETGILVEPGNTQELRNAIQFLLANPKEAKRLGENARQRILEKLNLETYVQNIVDLLLQDMKEDS